MGRHAIAATRMAKFDAINFRISESALAIIFTCLATPAIDPVSRLPMP